MHVTSLPSPYGIGDLGPAAFAWVNRLRDAGQTWWQSLPLGPTGCGNSPSGLTIAPLQDLLNLGAEGRMNVPGMPVGNWRWRCTEDMLKPSLLERLRELTASTGRTSFVKSDKHIRVLALGDQQTSNATV
jgi:4-alpha-glucanotransferase